MAGEFVERAGRVASPREALTAPQTGRARLCQPSELSAFAASPRCKVLLVIGWPESLRRFCSWLSGFNGYL